MSRSDLKTAQAARDKAADKAANAIEDVQHVKEQVRDQETESAQGAITAAEGARQAQADVDRLEQKIRTGYTGTLPQDLGHPHGVSGDAWGGPTAEDAKA